jgi:hypothetical protein
MTLGKINWSNLAGYTVQPSDMELFQTYAIGPFKNFLGGARTSGIIFGGRISIVSGLQLKISAGLALMPDGQLIQFDETSFTISAANASNPRLDRIELAYSLTNNSTGSDINSNTVVIDKLYTPSVYVNTGTAAASPTANSKTSSNVSLGIVTVGAGVTSIIAGNISQLETTAFETSAIQLGNKSGFIRMNQTSGLLEFSNNGSQWSSFGSGGGGGGGGANWVGVDGQSPSITFENNEKMMLFAQGSSQAMTLLVKIPTGYLSGSPIKLKMAHYSPGTTLNYKFQTTTTLIRKNVDAITSTTNQNVSTNSDVVNTVANLYTEVAYDVTTSTGLINSVAVSAGDLILIKLTRVTPTGSEDTNDVRAIPSSTEILFS